MPADRKELEVRRLLDEARAPVPADLGARVAAQGGRLLRRRHALRAGLWTLACIAVLAFTVWAVITQPWLAPPSETTPPVYTW